MSFTVLAPNKYHLDMFKNKLWKEKRKIEIIKDEYNIDILRKYFVPEEAGRSESCYLDMVEKLVTSDIIPKIYNVTDNYIDLEYIKGTRLHTIFMILKKLEKDNLAAYSLRKKLLTKVELTSKKIQLAMFKAKSSCSNTTYVYPFHDRLISFLELFNHCLNLDLNMVEINKEIEQANEYMKNLDSLVPFRDTAPKNFILKDSQLWRGNITENEQYKVVKNIVEVYGDSDSSPLLQAKIINIDFASCNKLTVPEDDPISLLLQESSWLNSTKSTKDFLWNNNRIDDYRFSIGLIMRLYSFGGRRLSYKLIHFKGFKKRYKDESISYYFDTLIEMSKTLCPSLKLYFPHVLDATYKIQNLLKDDLSIQRDWFLEEYQPAIHEYFSDVYPY